MDGKRRLIVLSATILATFALGLGGISHSSAAGNSARAVVANLSQPTPSPEKKPPEYWGAYKKGYGDAGKDCSKADSFSYNGSDWDRRGWVDGYNAGHKQLC